MNAHVWRGISIVAALIALALFLSHPTLIVCVIAAFFTWVGGVAMDRIYGRYADIKFSTFKSQFRSSK